MFSYELKEMIAKKEYVFKDLADTERKKEFKRISKKNLPLRRGKR